MESRMKPRSDLPPPDPDPESLVRRSDRGDDLPFDAVLAFDAGGIVQDFNPGAERLFGLSRDEAVGHDLGERLFRGELQRRFLVDLVRQFDCVEPAPEGRRVELVATRADGSRVPVELAVACLGDGGERRFIAFVRDMAGRKRDMEQLRRSEIQYRMLFRDNPHPMWVYDVETRRFLAVNAAAVAQYGYSEAEFLQMALPDIHREDDLGALDAALAHLPAQRRTPARWIHLRKDGARIDVDITSDSIEFGGRPARLVLAHDITSRLAAESGQASAHRALRMLGACNEAMIRIDDEKRLLDEICRIVVDIGGYSLAGVGYCQHDEEKSLLPMAAHGDHPEVVNAMRLSWGADSPYGQGPAGRCVRSGEPVVYSDISDPAQAFPWREKALAIGYRSAITLPLRNEAGSFGFLGMYADATHHVQGDELKLLQELVDNVAFGIGAIRARRDRRRIQAELEYNATHDAVTGLDKYAVLEARLAGLAAADDAPVAVLLVDLDRFSGVNEAVGHAHADDVLRTVAGRLLGAAGEHAHVAHLAGDEFVVVARVAAEDEALAVAERLRAAVCQPIEGDGYRLLITATIPRW
jgi:diguanylate cyclase (GGDEF)-like protein/PAS domain S-box-containing protein